tara:strand:+ start:103 stop:978 length:876 start_codon:yes stop_codon:yes gene_type:complete
MLKSNLTKTPFLLLAPYVTLIVLFWLIPLVSGINLSFQENKFFGEATYVGLANYKALLSDKLFSIAIVNTLIYTTLCVIIIIPLATTIAVLIQKAHQAIKPIAYFCLILPGLAPPVVLGILFLLVFYGRGGILNEWLITPLGFSPINWLKDPQFILTGLILQAVWRWTGFITLFILSALEAIPQTHIDSIKMEGGPNLRSFFTVNLPLIKKIIIFCALFLIVDSMVTFSGAYNILGASGGESNAGLLLVNYAYQNFHFGNTSTAAAINVCLMPFLALFVWTVMFFKPRKLK